MYIWLKKNKKTTRCLQRQRAKLSRQIWQRWPSSAIPSCSNANNALALRVCQKEMTPLVGQLISFGLLESPSLCVHVHVGISHRVKGCQRSDAKKKERWGGALHTNGFRCIAVTGKRIKITVWRLFKLSLKIRNRLQQMRLMDENEEISVAFEKKAPVCDRVKSVCHILTHAHAEALRNSDGISRIFFSICPLKV